MTSRAWVLVLCGCAVSGCASVSTMGLARTLNQGSAQGWVAPGGGGVTTLGAPTGTQNVGTGYPMVEGGVRFGVTDRFELGAKLGFSGIGLEGKVGLLRSETMQSGVNVSLAPGVTFVGLGVTDVFVGTLTFHLPVLIGIDFGGHELIIGPRLIDQLAFGAAGTAGAAINLLYGGGSLGIALRVSPSFRILPEVSVGVPFLASASVGGQGASGLGIGGLIFQAGLGFLFGGGNQYEQEARPPPLTPPPPPPPSAPPPLPPPAI